MLNDVVQKYTQSNSTEVTQKGYSTGYIYTVRYHTERI